MTTTHEGSGNSTGIDRSAEKDAPADYRCKWCGKVVKRQSTKAWIKSMCDATGYKTVHLTRVTSPGEGRA